VFLINDRAGIVPSETGIEKTICDSAPDPGYFLKNGGSQPVGATPSDMNSFSKGGVHCTRKTGQAFRGAEDRHVASLEGGRVVA
jgi:hypothetical protein